MTTLLIPEFEPEIVEARRVAENRFDSEKVPTTSLTELVVNGCRLTSRYQKAHEFRDMAGMLAFVNSRLRPRLKTMFCDSQACAHYLVTTIACSMEDLKVIAYELELGTRGNGGGHNGIVVTSANGIEHWRDPEWFEDFGSTP